MLFKFLSLVPMIFMLLAGFAQAGPLETSFCREIPAGVNFGDTPSDVILKMRREPETDAISSVSGHRILRYFAVMEQGRLKYLPLEMTQEISGEVSPAIGFF